MTAMWVGIQSAFGDTGHVGEAGSGGAAAPQAREGVSPRKALPRMVKVQ